MKIYRNVDLVEKGSETFGMQCRNAAIITTSLIICFYHQAHLSLAVMSVVPLIIMLNILSQRVNWKLFKDNQKISQTKKRINTQFQ